MLTINAWVQKQGYPPFCKVVTQEDGLANLQLIVDKVRGKEVPRVPAVSAFIEFCVGMMTGEVEKGGCRELRADPQLYATAGHGLSQAEMMMPLEKKGTFGWVGAVQGRAVQAAEHPAVRDGIAHLGQGGAATLARRERGQSDVRRVDCGCDEVRAE